MEPLIVPHHCLLQEGQVLADALPDHPESVFARQLLSRGLCPAYILGDPAAPLGALVQVFPDELLAFGDDPVALWTLIQPLHGWARIGIASPHADTLGRLLQQGMRLPIHYDAVLYYTLTAPVLPYAHPAVRLLTLQEMELIKASPGGSIGTAYGSLQALLLEGHVAGAVIDGVMVARAHTSCQSSRYADVAVATAEAWRGHGLASAAACLVCAEVQRDGRIPIWSATAANVASQRIANKLGFLEQSRMIYLVPIHP